MTINVILGLALDGPNVTELDDLSEGESRVGTLAIGPQGLLRDLELRLGLTADDTPPPVRVARYARRLEAAARGRESLPFWSASFEKDPLGTARELLRWRDELLFSGWNGHAVPDGGHRLDALAAVEALGADDSQLDIPALPAGEPDRWVAIQYSLKSGSLVPYTNIHVVDPVVLFPRRIRDVFEQLAARGTAVTEPRVIPTWASPESDLGHLQAHLLQRNVQPFTVSGDGSLLIIEAETATELAGATVALISEDRQGGRGVVVRVSDPAPLDYALRAAGMASQGLSSSSPLRPSFQVLPLVLELAYEPKDPYRVLELLTPPGGPFGGGFGRRLAEAFAGCPGIGNSDWEEAKEAWAESVRQSAEPAEADVEPDDNAAESAECRIATRLQRLNDWVEAPGSQDPRAPRKLLFDVVARVQKWLAGRAAHSPEGDSEQTALAAQAHAQAATLVSALAADPREALTIVEIRQLFTEALGGGLVTRLLEQAGRFDHVSDPAALLRPRDTVVFWGAIDVVGAAPNSPWTPSERQALAAKGVDLPDNVRLLEFHAEAARRALLLATGRVIFARSLTQLGQETAPHPLLDEVLARLGGVRSEIARITKDARAMFEGGTAVALAALALPQGRPAWSLDAGLLQRREHLSPSAIEVLVGCPLRFVLEREAGLRDSSVVSLPEENNLFGTIGHRLVEKLHEQRLLGAGTRLDRVNLRQSAETTLSTLLREEATPLLLPGRADACAQFRTQLLDSILALDDLLRRGKLTVMGVEAVVEVEWDKRTLEGRLDLLLKDSGGSDVVLDLKWGSTTYADKLEVGAAIQLATYAFVRRQQTQAKRLPEAGYYSLRKGEAIALSDDTFPDARVIDGPDLDLTWKRTTATLTAIEDDVMSGCIAAPGTQPETPAWQLGAQSKAKPDRFVPLPTESACEYCSLDSICGKRWQGIQWGDL